MKQSNLIKKLLAPRQMEYLTIDRDYLIVEASFGVNRFTESGDRELIGSDVRLALPELLGMEDMLTNMLSGTQPSYELKGVIRCSNQSSLYFDLYIVEVEDEIKNATSLILCLEDVTEKMTLRQELVQRANEATLLLNALTASKDYVEKIITSIAEALLVTNAIGTIKKVNQAAQQMFGYSEAELIDRSISMLFADPGFLEQSISGELLQNGEVTCKTKTGIEVSVAFSCSLIHTDAESDGFVYIGRDISDRKRIEADLQSAQIKAEQASLAKSAFLANMSHEIRTPMNGVLGMSELLLDTTLSPEQQDLVNIIQLSGNALLSLINGILDLSKLEAGEMQLEQINFNLTTCVEEVLELLAPQAHKKGLEITALIDPNVPNDLLGDSGRLRQILTNLVGNAIKFTAQGEVVVRVEKDQADPTSKILFSIIDTGIGIAREEQKRLFTPFSQVDASTTRRYGGTGLGLAICRQIVSLMGGEIGVTSRVSGVPGSKFWFSLPLPIQSAPSELLKVNWTGRSILVVDDNPICRNSIVNYATKWGVIVDRSEGISQTLEALARKSYDAVLLSLQMTKSRTDGIALAAEIKSNQALAELPLILLVTNSQRDVALHYRSLGFNDHLVKPIKSNRLWQLLCKLFNTSVALPSIVAQTPTSSQSLPLGSTMQSQIKILLADDNLVNQKVAVNQLKQIGYHADVASDGEEVLRFLSTTNYDIILMDCQMPILDGYATTQEIRHWEASLPESHHRIVIIAMTANAMAEDRDRCLAAGMDDYLSKPYRKDKLQSKLAHWESAINQHLSTSTDRN